MWRPTADLCDELGDAVRVLAPGLVNFGGTRCFAGPVTTLEVRDDNALVRAALAEPGMGRVLVIDGGSSFRCALVGGNLAQLAQRNQWAGIVVWGAVRDAAELAQCLLGIRALGTHPRRSGKTGAGLRDVPVSIGGVTIEPGQWLCADDDGVVVVPALAAAEGGGE